MIVLLIVSCLSAALSLIAELAFHLKPCFLCLIQRGLHLTLIPAALLFKRKACLFLLAASAFSATYHTFVQFHWVQDRCQTHIKDLASYKASLTNSASSCSNNTWKIGNVPIAAVNAITSAALFIFIAKRKNHEH